MKITETTKRYWADLSSTQKRVIGGVILLVLAFLISGWFSAIEGWQEIRVEKQAAREAKAEAQEALGMALKIAKKLRAEKAELADLEVKRNEKRNEGEKARSEVADAQAGYDRALREPVNRVPSTEELCARLAALGYSCDAKSDARSPKPEAGK